MRGATLFLVKIVLTYKNFDLENKPIATNRRKIDFLQFVQRGTFQTSLESTCLKIMCLNFKKLKKDQHFNKSEKFQS